MDSRKEDETMKEKDQVSVSLPAPKLLGHDSDSDTDSLKDDSVLGPKGNCVMEEKGGQISHTSPPPSYEDSAPKPPQRRQRKTTPFVNTFSPVQRTNSGSLTLNPSGVDQGVNQNQNQNQRIETISEDAEEEEKKEEEDDEEDKDLPSSSSSPRKYLSMEVTATIVAAFSFLCIGLQRAYTSPAIASMKEDHEFFTRENRMSNTVVSWVAAAPPLASFFGTILSGLALQYLGRQKTLVFLTLPYIGGWLLIAFAKNIPMIMTGRALTGLAAGFSTAAAPMYVSECVRAKVRGFLGFAPAMMLSLGILLGFSLSTLHLGWQDLALLMVSFPVLLFVFAIAVPESPSWLLGRGREKEAVESLKKLRGFDGQVAVAKQTEDQKEIEKEIEEMKKVLRKRHSLIPQGSRKKASVDSETGDGQQPFAQFVFNEVIANFGKREIRLPVFIALSLMVFQQLTGANAIINYLTVILNEADPSLPNATFINSFGDGKSSIKVHREGLDPNVAAVIFGLVQFFAFFLSLPLIDRLGRRVLLMTSALFMIFPHVLLGLYFWVKMYPNSYIHVYKYSAIIKLTSNWLPLLCLCGFIASYSIGFGPVPFLIMSEVFPSNARSYMVALASLVNHLTLFFIIRVFPTFFDQLGPHIVFWTLAVFCLFALIHVAIFIPETKGKTLAQIELELKRKESLAIGVTSSKEDKVKKGKKVTKDKCDCCKEKS